MVKYVNDYYEQMYEMFPEIPKKDIERILNFGWKQVYLLNSYGGDLVITDQHFWCFFGKLTKNSLRHYTTYVRKLVVKLRVLFKRSQQKWDGYYYFALTDRQYENLGIKKRGRKKKNFNFGNQVLYRLIDECKIRCINRKYIYRVPIYNCFYAWTKYVPNFETNKAELVEVREPQKLKDILITNTKYEFL